MSTAKVKNRIQRLLKSRDKGNSGGGDRRRSKTTSSRRNNLNTQRTLNLENIGGGRSRANSAPPSSLTRQKTGQGNQGKARGDRANSLPGVSPSSSKPQISKPPALQRQNASRDVNKSELKPVDNSPRREFATGRVVFPVEKGGIRTYVPARADATERELKLGFFVEDASITKPPGNTLISDAKTLKQKYRKSYLSVQDANTGRTLFATETIQPDGTTKLEYLPKQGDATADELRKGKYVPDSDVEIPSKVTEVIDGEFPSYEFSGQRNLYKVKLADGTVARLPKKSQANAVELQQGRFVEDDQISAKAPLGLENALLNKKPTFDLGKGRKLFPVQVPDEDKPRYLPRESEATGLELARGLFIPDNLVDRHERKRRRTTLKGDPAENRLRRAQRANRLAGGVTSENIDTVPEPVYEAKDKTPLWDGFTPPTLPDNTEAERELKAQKERDTLSLLDSSYDLGKGRYLYPTEVAKGVIKYLPLYADASNTEKILGNYATFVPPEPLAEFLARSDIEAQVQRQTFDTELGAVKAYSEAAINQALALSSTLVLRSAKLVMDSARAAPELQQEFLDP